MLSEPKNSWAQKMSCFGYQICRAMKLMHHQISIIIIKVTRCFKIKTENRCITIDENWYQAINMWKLENTTQKCNKQKKIYEQTEWKYKEINNHFIQEAIISRKNKGRKIFQTRLGEETWANDDNGQHYPRSHFALMFEL